MKKLIIPFVTCLAFVSCSKEEDLVPEKSVPGEYSEQFSPAASRQTSAQTVVSFKGAQPATVYLSQGLNTIQTDSFNVSGGTAYINQFVFIIHGSPQLTHFKFYIDGGQIGSSISYSNDTVTVVPRKKVPLTPGNHNFILHAKTFGSSGSTFSITLSSAVITNSKKFMAGIENLPLAGNNFIFN